MPGQILMRLPAVLHFTCLLVFEVPFLGEKVLPPPHLAETVHAPSVTSELKTRPFLTNIHEVQQCVGCQLQILLHVASTWCLLRSFPKKTPILKLSMIPFTSFFSVNLRLTTVHFRP